MAESSQSRSAFLAERVAAAQGRPTFQVPFRQRQEDLLKIDVPIEFPLYNLRSGRTHRAQAQYVERHELPQDFFADPESPEAQAAQHAILLELINEGDLAEDLAGKTQQNPIVLTYDGFVVDGNRRTAALRDQGEAENLIAVVLPKDAMASEVYETELELQMARQTKAKYNWIDEALHVYWGVHELDEPIHAIAQRMNQNDAEIQAILGRLALVDQYLEWLGAPCKYHRVAADGSGAAEQSFIELYQRESRAQHRNLPELQRRAIRHACFNAIEQGGGYMDIRRIADSVRTRPAEVVRRVREALPEDLSERLDQPIEDSPAATSTGNSLLDQLAEADDDEAPPVGAELLNVVDEPADAPIVAPVIIQVAADLADEAREQAQHLDALRKVQRALRALNDVEIDEQTESPSEIATTLGLVVERAEQLAAELEAVGGPEV